MEKLNKLESILDKFEAIKLSWKIPGRVTKLMKTVGDNHGLGRYLGEKKVIDGLIAYYFENYVLLMEPNTDKKVGTIKYMGPRNYSKKKSEIRAWNDKYLVMQSKKSGFELPEIKGEIDSIKKLIKSIDKVWKAFRWDKIENLPDDVKNYVLALKSDKNNDLSGWIYGATIKTLSISYLGSDPMDADEYVIFAGGEFGNTKIGATGVITKLKNGKTTTVNLVYKSLVSQKDINKAIKDIKETGSTNVYLGHDDDYTAKYR